MNNKKIKWILTVVGILILNLIIWSFLNVGIEKGATLTLEVQSEQADTYQLFYTKEEKDIWSEEQSIRHEYKGLQQKEVMDYSLPREIKNIRIDMGTKESIIKLSEIKLKYLWKEIDLKEILLNNYQDINQIGEMKESDTEIIITSLGTDPFISIQLENLNIEELYELDIILGYGVKLLVSFMASVIIIVLAIVFNSIRNLGNELYSSRQLIWDLSKNDFKRKYTGSYLGVIWAFIQPIVIVVVYWFVFQIGFKTGTMVNFPFILWFISGIVPWFFFSDGIQNATYSMIEYEYLVKKIVFKISILPIVKIISAAFVHVFFIALTIGIFSLYGYYPHIYMIQIFYYTICTFCLILGICYSTCAIIIFFRDLGQFINIVLQVGMWMTPIVWDYTSIPEKYQWLLKINPMYYIVEGYRDAMISKVWFWERYNQTIYFWVVCISLFVIGTIVFKRLKTHFADVL